MVLLPADRARASRVRTIRVAIMLASYVFLIGAMLCANGVTAIKSSTEKPTSTFSNRRQENERRKQTRRVYSLLDHSLRICVFAFLSAVFAGLTLGVMCANTFTLEIIAESGPSPDCTYAATVLPLRKQGHKTLCTLIISNMLCNVLIVQEFGDVFDVIEAIRTRGSTLHVVDDSGSAIYKFVVSTLIIVIFAEILPMSICRSKYSLRVAAAGSIFVKVAMLLTYPLSASLGWFLDRVVGSEETGAVYDKKELRRLMVVHYEREGDGDTHMAKSELNLLLAAMDFHERTVGDIMTPIERTTYVKSSDLITPDFVEQLWMSGRSRVPVETSPGLFENILVVKDLMTVSASTDEAPLTVAQVVKAKDRLFAMVCAGTALPSMLKFFLEAQTHMAVVFEEPPDHSTTPALSAGFTTDFDSTARGVGVQSRSFPVVQSRVVGVVTMEDVVEELISSEIYDEYDRYDPAEDTLPSAAASVASNDGRTSQQLLVPKEPTKQPRVNFYSYFTHPTEKVPLTDAQVWAVAYFLNRTIACFQAWQVPYIKLLLDECKDVQLSTMTEGVLHTVPDASLMSPTEQMIEGNQSTSSSINMSVPRPSRSMTTFRGDHGLFLNAVMDDTHILYRRGIRSDKFLLVLGGRVELLVGGDNFRSKLQSFCYIGEDALTEPFFVPDFSAIVMTAARMYSIPKDLYDKYLSYQSVSRHRNRNVRILGPGSPLMMRRAASRSALNTAPMVERDALLTPLGDGSTRSSRVSAYGTFSEMRRN